LFKYGKHVWDNHERSYANREISSTLGVTLGVMTSAGAGQWLRDNDYLQPKETCPRGVWVATSKGKNAATAGISK